MRLPNFVQQGLPRFWLSKERGAPGHVHYWHKGVAVVAMKAVKDKKPGAGTGPS